MIPPTCNIILKSNKYLILLEVLKISIRNIYNVLFYIIIIKNIIRKMDGKLMKKSILLICTIVILVTMLLCGCQEESNTKQEAKNVFLDSNLVQLIHSNLTFNLDNGIIKSASVEYLFKNLLDRQLEINVSAQFYDKNDNLLGTIGTKDIVLPPLYEETGISPLTNVITYDGLNVSDVDYVRLIVEEKE